MGLLVLYAIRESGKKSLSLFDLVVLLHEKNNEQIKTIINCAILTDFYHNSLVIP